MTIAIACEWIESSGGAERVLDSMLEAFPGATVHTLWNDAPSRLPGVAVQESWMARTPLRRHKSLALPLMAPTWRHLHASVPPDKLLVSSYAFAHHAWFPKFPDVSKYTYVHSPARYLWAPEIDPRGRQPLVRAAAPYLRRLDHGRAQESLSLATNSRFVQARVQRAWDREATVIYPPVEVDTIMDIEDWRDALLSRDQEVLESLPADFILGASRFVAYKRLEDVIRFGLATGLPVVLAGTGPDRARLEGIANQTSATVIFLGEVSTPLLYALFQQARAFVFPPVEDFGIMPVEAMAAGARVIVNSRGGAAESVIHLATGMHLSRFDGADAVAALEGVERLDSEIMKKSVVRFSEQRFVDEVRNWVDRN